MWVGLKQKKKRMNKVVEMNSNRSHIELSKEAKETSMQLELKGQNLGVRLRSGVYAIVLLARVRIFHASSQPVN